MTRIPEPIDTTTTTNLLPAQAEGGTARMAGGERRQQILVVAMSLFSQRGFRGTTTKQIAEAAGVSEAMVFRHFATKEELYAAILDHKACADGLGRPCHLVADAIREKDDRAVFGGLARALMKHHDEDTEFLRLLMHAALEGHQLADMFWERNVREMYEFLGGYIRERQRDGAMRALEPAVVVRAFLGMVIHHSLNNTLWDRSRTLLNLSNERAADEFTDIILRGVAALSSSPPARHRRGRAGGVAMADDQTAPARGGRVQSQSPARGDRGRKKKD